MVVHADCLEWLPTLEAESVALVFADPPYNIGKAEWDWVDAVSYTHLTLPTTPYV